MSRLEEIKARAEKAIVELVLLLPEQISYAEYVGANSCYGSGPYIWTDPEPYVMDEAAKLIKELLGEVSRLTAERDAALRDLKHMGNCDICAHGQAEVPGCDVECEGCKLDCACRDCRNEDKWQWRGPEPGGSTSPPDNYIGEQPVAYGAPFDEPIGEGKS